MFSRLPGARFNRGRFSVAVAAGSGVEPGNWSATSTVDSRTGFTSALPEFEASMAPEVEDSAAMYLLFEEDAVSGSVKLGAPVYLECSLTGTFAAGSLAATGAVGGFAIEVAATLSGAVLGGTVTITNGSHEEVRLFNATAGADSITIPAGYWVDAVNGDDGNDASAPDQAVQTIGGLPALSAGDRVYLARGSRWRELLDTSAANACHVVNYGIGPRPILDACDAIPAASWTKTAGRTNIYETTVTGTHTSVAGAAYSAIVLDTGWQLEPLSGADLAASLTLVDAQAGSHVAQTLVGGGAVTIYAHLYGASKVPTDGRVEISIRPTGLLTTGSARVEGVMCRAGYATSGAFNMGASGAAVDNAYVDDCVSLHGNDHNILFPGGEVRRTVCLGMNSGANSNGQFVAFRNTIDPTATLLLHEFAAIQFLQLTDATAVNTYTAHSGGGGGNWLDVTFSRCYSYNNSGWSIMHGLVNECLFERPRGTQPAIGILTVAGNLTVRNTRVLGVTGGTGATNRSIENGAGTLVIENFVSWRPGDTISGAHVLTRGGTCAVSNSHFFASATDVWDDNTVAGSVSLSRVSTLRGATAELAGSTVTPVNFIACLAASDWRENSAASARDFSPDYVGANAYGDCATYTTTMPVYEVEVDPARPIFLETAASVAARGWDIGPEQTRPGSGVSWVTPEVGSAWRTFIDGLAGPPT